MEYIKAINFIKFLVFYCIILVLVEHLIQYSYPIEMIEAKLDFYNMKKKI